MPVERVTLIAHCAECVAVWLPADEERWAAHLTDDEPRSLFSTARYALSGSSIPSSETM
jgi:hypothetical protein